MKIHSLSIAMFILVASLLVSCSERSSQSSNTSDSNITTSENSPVISFDKSVHDFGKIIASERVAYAFRFTNTGKSPLLITGIRSGCGCTVGDYPKDPIKPGEQARINVVFNSSGRKGFQSESISVLNNTSESPVNLRITAEVLEQ